MPLIAVQSQTGAGAADYVRRDIKLPATAFMRLEGGLAELDAGRLRATIELYLGTDRPSVDVEGVPVPLQTDITAPLAYTLEESKLWDFALSGFRRGVTKGVPSGVFMLEPYQNGKIPLVLVHGTASSPAAWAQTINGIMADPRMGSRYQVWLAIYNTGNPIAYSASIVREALVELVEELDPESDDAALSRMVVVGHSQGGLVSRLLVTSAGDDVWYSITNTPFDEYELDEEHRDLLGRVLFFEPLPFIERVVFISTPHRGSYVAGSWIGRLARKLVTLPKDLANTTKAFLSRSDLPPELRTVPTSVDNMEPGSRFVQIVGTLPFREELHLNSIVAVKPRQSSIEDGNDGVVAYSSAHLAEAESELVVRHGHSCQGEPETIGELRRILFAHVGIVRPTLEEVRTGP
jgi:pimeloyl-ACP methyl ester carboxylesterase